MRWISLPLTSSSEVHLGCRHRTCNCSVLAAVLSNTLIRVYVSPSLLPRCRRFRHHRREPPIFRSLVIDWSISCRGVSSAWTVPLRVFQRGYLRHARSRARERCKSNTVCKVFLQVFFLGSLQWRWKSQHIVTLLLCITARRSVRLLDPVILDWVFVVRGIVDITILFAPRSLTHDGLLWDQEFRALFDRFGQAKRNSSHDLSPILASIGGYWIAHRALLFDKVEWLLNS